LCADQDKVQKFKEHLELWQQFEPGMVAHASNVST
jgi:hypothetical protein